MTSNNYVDLGLPSGTLWATMNVGAESIVDCGKYFTYKEAIECDITLPTTEQFLELIGNTTYVWVENYNNCGVNGNLFIGENGKEVFFPASGYFFHDCGLAFGQFTNSRDIKFTLRGVKNK